MKVSEVVAAGALSLLSSCDSSVELSEYSLPAKHAPATPGQNLELLNETEGAFQDQTLGSSTILTLLKRGLSPSLRQLLTRASAIDAGLEAEGRKATCQKALLTLLAADLSPEANHEFQEYYRRAVFTEYSPRNSEASWNTIEDEIRRRLVVEEAPAELESRIGDLKESYLRTFQSAREALSGDSEVHEDRTLEGLVGRETLHQAQALKELIPEPSSEDLQLRAIAGASEAFRMTHLEWLLSMGAELRLY
ncbi:MAG: hypothetical protein KDD70_08575 [Bdellovibrionales bacterium]|nr:hypothetical protein [Bdellovibrionales bacterium]